MGCIQVVYKKENKNYASTKNNHLHLFFVFVEKKTIKTYQILRKTAVNHLVKIFFIKFSDFKGNFSRTRNSYSTNKYKIQKIH